MTASIRVQIEPKLLVWGRETAGYALDDAAKKIGVAPDKLAGAELGDVQLTYAQLKKTAEVYKRPLAVFFLDTPPPVPEVVHDFRMSPDFAHRPLSSRLIFEIRKARQHRQEAIELADELGQEIPPFLYQAELQQGVDQVALRVRELLGISLRAQFGWADNNTALKAWKRAVESLSVLVFETSRIEVDEMRGASLPEEMLPVVVLNGGDSQAGRTFTLLHEFTHLLLRQGGVCDLAPADVATPDAKVEAFCNAVAASTLVPADALIAQLPRPAPQEWSMEQLAEIATRFRVSKEAILRRLLVLGYTTEAHYAQKREEFLQEYRELRRRRVGSTGGPEPAVMAVRNLGRPFISLVLNAYIEDRIALSAVSDYLGLKLKHLPRIEDLMRRDEKAA